MTWEDEIEKLFLHRLSYFHVEMQLINNFAPDGGSDRLGLLLHTQTELKKQWPENNNCPQINSGRLNGKLGYGACSKLNYQDEFEWVHVEYWREFPGFTQQIYPDIPEYNLLSDYSL